MATLTPREMRVLEGARLVSRKSFTGHVRGERLTSRRGISIEFADYRNYTEGDDLRHLDWNILARLDSAVMKTYRDEEDLAVHLLLDPSPSMAFGEPLKSEVACRYALAFGYLALAGGDALLPQWIGSGLPRGALRGRAAFTRLMEWSSKPPTGTSRTLSASLRSFANSSARTGLVVLISDGMDPEAPSAVKALVGRGHEVAFLQILSDVEQDPDLEGDLRLIDAENGRPVEITASAAVLREYHRRLQAHNDGLAEAVRRGGGRHALVTTKDSFESTVKDVFKRRRWIQ